ncbi:asparaginase [Devosia sp. YR412]|uniref:asparaginase n=1 Tax=Devosia sp. YR412 TaxID=1881030 RepID=UPI0008ACE8CE|nr:asparaginase [Devosia sp. YR412]SEP73836.1 asparaginase [Devosia sp. YR412]
MKRVTVVSTGGTIASGKASDHSVVADRKGAALIATLHDPLDGMAVEVDDFASVGSYALDLATVYQLVRCIAGHLERDDCDGVVVTHGTDTMEETAFIADLLIGSDKPVVFTGAQRHADMPDTDGPRNVADAIRVAAAPIARGLGSLLVFEGDIHAAATVSKTHTARVDTFRSAGYGKLGEIDNGVVYIQRRPERRVIADHGLVEGIELVKPGLGSSTAYLDFCASAGVPGVIIEAFGRGNAPRGYADAVARLVKAGAIVVIASRCPEGRTLPVYGADSGATTLQAAGAIFAGELSAIKSRLLLSALLAAKADRNAIAEAFARY